MDATAPPRGISLAVGEPGARRRPTFYITSRTAVSVNRIRSLRPSTVFVDVCPRDTHTPHGLSCFGGRELRGPHGRLSSALPRGGGEQGGGGIGVVGRGLGFRVTNTCLSGRGLGTSEASSARHLPLLPRGSE